MGVLSRRANKIEKKREKYGIVCERDIEQILDILKQIPISLLSSTKYRVKWSLANYLRKLVASQLFKSTYQITEVWFGNIWEIKNNVKAIWATTTSIKRNVIGYEVSLLITTPDIGARHEWTFLHLEMNECVESMEGL